MVKVSESAIKTVSCNKPKRLLGLSQKASEAGCSSLHCDIVGHKLPGREQAPNPTYSWKRNLETPYRSRHGSGQRAVRHAYGGAGLGCWKKRMPCCNGADTGLKVTRHESEPTSDGSFIARKCVEQSA